MVVVKSKLKKLAYKPEVQQTDMTSVYETCQNSQIGQAVKLRMQCVCIPCSLNEMFKTTG